MKKKIHIYVYMYAHTSVYQQSLLLHYLPLIWLKLVCNEFSSYCLPPTRAIMSYSKSSKKMSCVLQLFFYTIKIVVKICCQAHFCLVAVATRWCHHRRTSPPFTLHASPLTDHSFAQFTLPFSHFSICSRCFIELNSLLCAAVSISFSLPHFPRCCFLPLLFYSFIVRLAKACNAKMVIWQPNDAAFICHRLCGYMIWWGLFYVHYTQPHRHHLHLNTLTQTNIEKYIYYRTCNICKCHSNRICAEFPCKSQTTCLFSLTPWHPLLLLASQPLPLHYSKNTLLHVSFCCA